MRRRFRFVPLVRLALAVVALVAGLFSFGTAASSAADEKTVREPIKALFISIESYDDQQLELKYAKNDVSEFSSLLQTKFAAKSESIIDQPGDFTPTDAADCYKNAIEEKIKQWCGELSGDETAILYLAGHGVPGSDGKLYLPMRNWDKKKESLPTMGIPLEWVRETYGAAEAKCKLILIDTCYSGTSRGIGLFEVSDAASMAQVFDRTDRMATVASSQADQQSYFWNLVRHSLFTYWLIQAFDGDADLNEDHFITLPELSDYLTENVSRVSEHYEDIDDEKEYMKLQIPAVLNADSVGDQFRVPVPAFSKLNRLVTKLAKQIDLKMRMNGYGNIVVVPKLVTGPEGSCTIDPSYGNLPQAVANKFIAELKNLNNTVSNYTVFNKTVIEELFEKKNIKPENLGGMKTSDLEIGGKPVKTILSGRIYLYSPHALKVSVELLDAETMESLMVCSGETLLDEGDMSANGASFVRRDARPVDRLPDPVRLEVLEDSGLLVSSDQAEKVREEDAASAERSHPMLDTTRFRITIQVRKAHSKEEFKNRTGTVIGKDYYIYLNSGEEFEIELENKNDFPVWARVLVNGKGTLAQLMTIVEKGVTVESSKNKDGEMVLAPFVALNDARPYYLKKKSTRKIKGFGWPEKNIIHRFEVTDSFDDISPGDNYADRLGWITVGFYTNANARSIPDIVPGTGVSHHFSYKTDSRPGDSIAVYNICYVSQDMYDELVDKELRGDHSFE